MAFTLDKTQGKGKATVKVTPEVNHTGNKVMGQILVQVNGITKQVVQLVQRAESSQEDIKIYLTIDNPYISGVGGTSTFSYWAVDNGTITNDNLELVFEPEGSADVEFQLGPVSKDPSGKVNRSITLPANNINETKELKFHARHVTTGSVSDTLVVSLLGKDMTILPDFDFFCFNYSWDEAAGKDLDSATLVVGSNIPIVEEGSGNTLDDYFVGYMGNGNEVEEVKQYLKFGGDNTQSGAEGALVNFKEICNRDLISQGVTKLYIYIYGNWYDKKITGDMTLSYRTYKGTGMIQEGYEFKPNSDTVLVTDTSRVINCNAFSSFNAPLDHIENVKKFYSLLATIEYDVATSNAAFKPNLTKSGRSIKGSVVFDGETINFDGAGHADKYINLAPNIDGSHRWSNAKEVVDIDPNTGSASTTNMYVNREPTVPAEDWISVEFTRDDSGHITGMAYSTIRNDTGSPRTAVINVYFEPSVSGGAYHLEIKINQTS